MKVRDHKRWEETGERERGGKGERWETKEAGGQRQGQEDGMGDWVWMHQWQSDHEEAPGGRLSRRQKRRREEAPRGGPAGLGAPGQGGPREVGGPRGCRGPNGDGSYSRRSILYLNKTFYDSLTKFP